MEQYKSIIAEEQVNHESALVTLKSSIHTKYKTLLYRAENEKSEIIETTKQEIDVLKRTLADTENQLSERIQKDSEIDEERRIELTLLQQRVKELEQVQPIIAPSSLEITAAEERGRQGGLREKDADVKVLEETLNVSYLVSLAQNRGSPFYYQAQWGARLRNVEATQKRLFHDLEKKFEMERSTCQVRDSHPGYTCTSLHTSWFLAC